MIVANSIYTEIFSKIDSQIMKLQLDYNTKYIKKCFVTISIAILDFLWQQHNLEITIRTSMVHSLLHCTFSFPKMSICQAIG